MATATPFTVEREWHRPDGRASYLVRVAGGRHLQVAVPANMVRGDQIEAIINEAIRLMPPALGLNTRAGFDE